MEEKSSSLSALDLSKLKIPEINLDKTQGFAMAGAFCLGALLMYMFDPTRGNARQARVRDQIYGGALKTGDYFGSKSRHIANVVKGTVYEAGHLIGMGGRSKNGGEVKENAQP